MNEVIKILEEIKEYQMQNVQLARTTEVYKLAEKAIEAINFTDSSLQLKEKETPTFKDWLKDTYIKLSDNKYQHRKYHFIKDGYQVHNIYNILKDNL